MIEQVKYIRERLSQEEMLAQLAEECAELGKAALKLRRCYNGENPTPVSKKEAYDNLIEEIADVKLCMAVLGLNTPSVMKECSKIRSMKINRWAQRLRESKE